MKVTVKDREIELKNSFRNFMIYENITGKSFEPKGLQDILVYFYSTILGSSKDIVDLKFDEFIDMIDADPQLVTDFSTWITNINEINSEISQESKVEQGGSKKTTKKSKK